jgi:hypothetical protein
MSRQSTEAGEILGLHAWIVGAEVRMLPAVIYRDLGRIFRLRDDYVRYAVVSRMRRPDKFACIDLLYLLNAWGELPPLLVAEDFVEFPTLDAAIAWGVLAMPRGRSSK